MHTHIHILHTDILPTYLPTSIHAYIHTLIYVYVYKQTYVHTYINLALESAQPLTEVSARNTSTSISLRVKAAGA